MIALNTQPAHLTSFKHPVHPDYSDVVLGVTGRRAGPAADTLVQIDHHPPAIVFIFYGRIKITLGIVAFGKREGQWEMGHGQIRFFMLRRVLQIG